MQKNQKSSMHWLFIQLKKSNFWPIQAVSGPKTLKKRNFQKNQWSHLPSRWCNFISKKWQKFHPLIFARLKNVILDLLRLPSDKKSYSILSLHAILSLSKNIRKVLSVNFSWNFKTLILGPFWPFGQIKFFPKTHLS